MPNVTRHHVRQVFGQIQYERFQYEGALSAWFKRNRDAVLYHQIGYRRAASGLYFGWVYGDARWP